MPGFCYGISTGLLTSFRGLSRGATLTFGTGDGFILTGGSSKLFRMIYKDLLKNDLQPTAFGFLGSPFLDGLRYRWFMRNTLEMIRIFFLHADCLYFSQTNLSQCEVDRKSSG